MPSAMATKIFQRIFGGYAELPFLSRLKPRTIISSYECRSAALTHASMDSDNHPITLCLLCSQSPPKAYNVLRTFHSPSEFISPMDIRFCFVVLAQLPNPLRVLSKTQPWLNDYGCTCGRPNGTVAR